MPRIDYLLASDEFPRALAEALLFPGRLSRLDNLSQRGRQAGLVALGVNSDDGFRLTSPQNNPLSRAGGVFIGQFNGGRGSSGPGGRSANAVRLVRREGGAAGVRSDRPGSAGGLDPRVGRHEGQE